MAFSFTFVAMGSTNYNYIHRTLSALSLGTIGEITITPIRARAGMVSVVCHYNTFTEVCRDASYTGSRARETRCTGSSTRPRRWTRGSGTGSWRSSLREKSHFLKKIEIEFSE